MTSHPDVLYALARARQSDAAAWAERRRLVTFFGRMRRDSGSPPSPASLDVPRVCLRARQCDVRAQGE